MDQSLPFPQTELQLRTDVVLDELDRLHAAWIAGRTPTPAELDAVADDLAALRATMAFASVVEAFHAPSFAPAA